MHRLTFQDEMTKNTHLIIIIKACFESTRIIYLPDGISFESEKLRLHIPALKTASGNSLIISPRKEYILTGHGPFLFGTTTRKDVELFMLNSTKETVLCSMKENF